MKKTKLNVMIVDDSLLVGERIRNLVKELKGVSIIAQAESTKTALQFVENQKPDVILLDINMPGESGVEFLKKVKQSYSNIMVIMLSNFSDRYYRNLCKEYGADHFFDKSMEFEKVLDVLVATRQSLT
ncbi:MAG: response regulator transcription factor [Bacteroidia bacterium]|nr:response regulator transcription factor [Bacteroidia bacterium]